jgi:prolyl-tRNA editing enzyme YbaK/EbsC (Cys-tRNA(Pro) deacylase)
VTAPSPSAQRATGFAIGGVPPFGHSQPIPVYCDRDLLAFDTVWAAAGTPRDVFSVDPNRLAQACAVTIADLKETP